MSKTIQDVASKISSAKASGMFKNMMPTGASNFASSISQKLSPVKTSIQEGSFIDEEVDVDYPEEAEEGEPDEAVEAALLEAANDDTTAVEKVDNVEKKFADLKTSM